MFRRLNIAAATNSLYRTAHPNSPRLNRWFVDEFKDFIPFFAKEMKKNGYGAIQASVAMISFYMNVSIKDNRLEFLRNEEPILLNAILKVYRLCERFKEIEPEEFGSVFADPSAQLSRFLNGVTI